MSEEKLFDVEHLDVIITRVIAKDKEEAKEKFREQNDDDQPDIMSIKEVKP